MICPFTTAGSVMGVSVLGGWRIRPRRNSSGSKVGSGFLLAKFGQPADVKRQGIGDPARRFHAQFAQSGLGIGSQGDLDRDGVGQGRLSLSSHELGAGPAELLLDLEHLLQGLDILGALLPKLLELVLQHLSFLRRQGPDVFSHGGLDAAPGEVRLKDVDLIISFPGAQKLPADRDQERRALSAAGRKDVADSRTLLRHGNG